ncbi:MAG: MerR family transcriptional regulator [Dehalococcoidales bacterium]|nr:MerR family transcriptional regulator [Dehalococcoidales bacterium]
MSTNGKNTGTGENEPRYVISVAAKMLGIQVYTLRYYEKIGIIEPHRSRGNIRLYSDEDIETLRRVKSLMDEMGINLAGAEVVLRIIRRMNELQGEVERLRAELKQFEEEVSDL